MRMVQVLEAVGLRKIYRHLLREPEQLALWRTHGAARRLPIFCRGAQKENMKTVLYLLLIAAIAAAALLITKAIVQSDLPLWIKIFLLK